MPRELALLITLGVLVALAVAQTIVLVLLWRRTGKLQARLDALWQNAAGASTDVPTSMLVATLGRLERQLSKAQQSPPPGRSWDLAQQLAREGADAEQLVTRCGLSRDEANLLLKMHATGA